MQRNFSRRSFLRIAGATALGVGLPAVRRASAFERPIAYGRSLMVYVTVYNRPSVYGRQLAFHPLDSILLIYEEVKSEDENTHNPNWYRTHSGYIHASNVQPVNWRYNLPRTRLPATGQLVDLTVPFTTARRDANADAAERYRLYYGSTYWAMDAITDRQGVTWYALWDDRINETFFAPARTLRLVKESDLAPISPNVTGKWIQIDTSSQLLTAFEDTTPVFETLISSGRNYSGDPALGDFRTPLGTHTIHRKRPERHMAAGDAAATDFFDLPGVSWVSYFSGGMAFHGTYWHNDYGTPWSHGCINMRPEDARWLYRWTEPYVQPNEHSTESPGTRVEVI